jgi:pimeloyl-ACP methyl ester carboxylesterase
MNDAANARRQLYDLLGELPARDRPIHATVLAEENKPTYWLERLLLDLNGVELVPAYFIRPKGTHGRLPTVLYQHAHGGDWSIGKEELVSGRSALCDPPYAEALAAQGCAALCIDHWNFGGRQRGSESALFKEMLWNGRVLWGWMVYDSIRSLDYLTTRHDVDAERIATLGMSMGSTMSWWLAALDERIRATVDLCCLTDFQALIEAQGLDGHGIYYYVPGLLKKFTTSSINVLIAPRPHLSLAGNQDALTPSAGLDRIDRDLTEMYASLGRSDVWRLHREDVGHQETPTMRRASLEFLQKWL